MTSFLLFTASEGERYEACNWSQALCLLALIGIRFPRSEWNRISRRSSDGTISAGKIAYVLPASTQSNIFIDSLEPRTTEESMDAAIANWRLRLNVPTISFDEVQQIHRQAKAMEDYLNRD